MTMDDFEPKDIEETESQSGESGNRTFVMVVGVLGAILIVSLIAIAVYALVIVPRGRNQEATQQAEIAQSTEVAIQNTELADAAQQTAAAAARTPTSTPTKRPSTPTSTSVLVATATSVIEAATEDPRTATVAALETSQAETGTPEATSTATALPDTGFGDDIGAPGLVALAAALIIIIFLARRLRTAR